MSVAPDQPRPRCYIRWDADFLGDDLGAALYDRFGSAGIALFLGFMAACKRNLVAGQMSYGSDGDLLAQVGLPGLRLVNEDGEAWTVDEFWTWLGHMKQTRRTRRGRLSHVVATRWTQWQSDWNTAEARERKRRSRGAKARDTSVTETGQVRDESVTQIQIQREITPPTPPAPVVTPDVAAAAQPGGEQEPSKPGRTWAAIVAALPPDDAARIGDPHDDHLRRIGQLLAGGWTPTRIAGEVAAKWPSKVGKPGLLVGARLGGLADSPPKPFEHEWSPPVEPEHTPQWEANRSSALAEMAAALGRSA